MNTDHLKRELQSDLSASFPKRGFPYQKVAALVLYWTEDDFQPPCKDEAREVKDLFSTGLGYDTVVFPIPSTNSRNALEKAVVDFKYAYDLGSNLMIVYYSGHGDPDDKRGKAVWAAKAVGEPTIDWFEVQPHLENASADVLFIFDCCHASQAAKNRRKGSLELLAASSAGGQTPCPGKYSFTRYLVDELQKALVEKNGLQVDELHARINRRVMHTTRVTPVHFTLRPDPAPSILLRPHSRSPSTASPLGALTITVSVLEPPSRHSIQKLGDWIKRTAPNSISGIKVDRVVDLSGSLRDFLLDDGKAGISGRFIDSLGPKDKGLLLTDLNKLSQNIVDARISETIQVAGSAITTSSPEPNTAADGSTPLGSSIFQKFEMTAQKLFQNVWNATSKHPTFQRGDLKTLQQNEVAQQAGLTTTIGLSLLARDEEQVPDPEPKFIPCEDFIHKRLLGDNDRFSLATKNDQLVIVEIVRYLQGEDGSPPQSMKAQFPKTSSFLSRPKPEYFQILRCIGYTQDKSEGWYGLAFSIPEGSSTHSTLEGQFGQSPRVPLEIRYRLAYRIALSLYGLHSVGWIHKGIRSENILFFHKSKNNDKTSALDQPWLFGFEYARETGQSSSQQPEFRMNRLLYLPPSRWGTPSAKFGPEHDIYSLGVLLLEIGFWVNAEKLPGASMKHIRKAEDAQAQFIKSAGKDLSHIMGTRFAGAVSTCLKGHVGERQLDFRKDIIDILEGLALSE
ncbi:uncharacterized protein A1O5_05538 [Cladophialophora psammophila CBS 110553]|uniref:Protein kinase domain-containing protein n=1 Tax=Cladophialophora psammophila CBS 110553 TaxID=1182543 RepID=W9XN00_9EURO|nr:uncharacterized protein A1O5_05538 [Cladophialophora psammophila CBS 110553]EXJ71729.1 hypothetical protein A1O5_05538 [Cladophialophora psammophila CBS 110553]